MADTARSVNIQTFDFPLVHHHFQVTILKLQFKYEESQKLLPSNLQVANVTDPQILPGGGDGGGAMGDLMKTVAVSDNAGVVEFVMEDNDEGNRSVDINTAMTGSSDLSSLISHKQLKDIILVKSACQSLRSSGTALDIRGYGMN